MSGHTAGVNSTTHNLPIATRFASRVTAIASIVFLSSALSPLSAQSDPAPVRLDPFEVNTTPETYRASDSVSATRIAVPLENLPINISIANAAFMQEAQVLDIIDVLRYKGINANRDIRFNSMFIRGFNNTLQKRNGVARRYNWQTVNIEQVEIVKGPASILYGAVLPGGAVMSVSKKPLPEAHAEAFATVGSYEFLRAAVDFGAPVTDDDKLIFRMIAERQDSEDFYYDTFVKRTLLNPTLRWQATERLRFDFEYEYVRHAEHQTHYFSYYNDASVATQPIYPQNTTRLPRFPATGFSWGFLDLPERNHNSAPGGFFELDTDWYEATAYLQLSSEWTVRWLFNYNEAASRTKVGTIGSLPYAGGQYADFRPAAGRSEFENTTTFIEMTGRFRVGSVEVVPLFGAEYAEGTDMGYTWTNPPPVAVVRIDEVYRSGALFELADPIFTRRPNTTREQKSVYGIAQAEIVPDRFRMLAGLRYEEGETNPLQQGVGPGNSFDALSSQLGFVYHPGDRTTLFLNLSESFVPNTTVNPDGSTLPLEEGSGAELGLRWIQTDGRLALTATVFETVRDKMARLDTGRTFDEINNPQRLNYFTTSGEEKVRGAELELFARPLPWWELTLNYNWLPYGKVISFPNRPDIEGNRLRYAPEHGAAVWSKIWLGGDRKGFFFYGGLTYQSETLWDSDQQFTTIRFDAWTNVDAGAGWSGELFGQEMRFELLGKNLTDNELTITYRPQDRRKLFFTTTVTF